MTDIDLGGGAENESALDVVRDREMRGLYIVDDAMRVVFSSNPRSPGELCDLPRELGAIVDRLRQQLLAAKEQSGVGVVTPTELVRVQRLEARNGAAHYAVFLERFATRNSVQKAVERFKLSAREAEVLEGLVRGDATKEIAAGLGICATTVLEHVRNIGTKMKVTKRSAIVALVFALR